MITIKEGKTYLPIDYTGFPDEEYFLNEMQELCTPYIEEKEMCNLVVEAPTASGKSTIPKMLGKKVLDEGNNIIYIGIMKALAEEKADDWSQDNWKDYPQVTVTSDFRSEDDYENRLNNARIICITPESLASRLRRVDSASNAWLANVGLLVVDEMHLTGDGDRGANMEAALIEFAHMMPNCRVLGLSATMPNVQDFAKWLENITNRKSEVVSSSFRPVPVEEWFIPYTPESKTREGIEKVKTKLVLDLVLSATKKDQQFLVAVFSKAYGRRLLESLKEQGVSAEFHNADIPDKATKKRIENDFKAGRIRVLISTSTLFIGVNLPARNVIITSVEAGGNNIPVHTLKQAAGRAGRPKYDTEGDAFYFVPSARSDEHIERITNGEPIMSQMSSKVYLAMHFLGAVYLKRITCKKSFKDWYAHTLAYVQGAKNDFVLDLTCDAIIEDLRKQGMLKQGDDFQLSRRGIITAQMYLDPYNFSSALWAIQKYSMLQNPTELDYIRAMSTWEAYATNSISYEDKLAIPDAVASIPEMYRKAAAVIWYRVNGKKVPASLTSINAMIWSDLPRMQAAVERIITETNSNIEISPERLELMFTRIISQASWEQAELAVAKFSKKERTKMAELGIYTYNQAKNNLALIEPILGQARVEQLKAEANRVTSTGAVRFGKK